MMEIRNAPEPTVELKEVHLKEIIQYLIQLDLIHKIAERSDTSGDETYRLGIAQPGLRYAQVDALVEALMRDNVFGELPLAEKNLVLDRIRNEIKGRMMEDMQRSAAEKIGGFMESATATPDQEPPDPRSRTGAK